MRIINVSFQNINSLAGEWSIDFSSADYQRGLFAITGPTGAGKSSILDAVSLALYGQTPRLGKVWRGGFNEIMSRGSARCYAEVVFETKAGRYRCQWSQWRARFSLDGELQPPRHEISDADTGKIIGSSLKKVPEVVEEVTGLDFHRFTRSMLLAQGDFAVFLKADPDERAPILERITGTAIYSQISKAVHERKNSELAKLSSLEKELGTFQAIDDTELKQLKEELLQLENDLQDKKAQREQGQSALNIFLELESLEKRRKELFAAGQQWKEKSHAFETCKKRLELDAGSRSLCGPYEALSLIRKECLRAEEEVKALDQLLPSLEAGLKIAKEKADTAAVVEERARQARENYSGQIIKARALDVEIKEVSISVDALNKRIDPVRAAIFETKKQISNYENELDKLKDNLSSTVIKLDKQASDEFLINNFSLIKVSLNALRQFVKKREQQEKHIKLNENNLNKLNNELKIKQTEISELKKIISTSNQQIQDKNFLLNNALLDNKGLSYWRSFLLEIKDRYVLFKQCANLAEALKRDDSQIKILKEKIKHQLEFIISTRRSLERENANLADVEKHIVSLEKELALRPANLDELRSTLKSGEPCPLCGSKEHPFALEDRLMVKARMTEVEAELKERKERITSLRLEETRLKMLISSNEAKQDKDSEQLQDLVSRRSQNAGQLRSLAKELSISEDISFDDLTVFGKQLLEIGNRAAEAVAHGELVEKELKALKEEAEKIEKQLGILEKDINENIQNSNASALMLKRDQQEYDELKANISAELSVLKDKICSLGLDPWDETACDAVEALLQARLDIRLGLHKQSSDLNGKIKEIENKLSLLRSSLAKDNGSFTDLEEQLKEGEKRLGELKRQRSSVLNGEDPSIFENKLKQEHNTSLLHLQSCREEMQKMESQLNAQKVASEAAQKDFLRLNNEQIKKEKEFNALLGNLYIADEKNWLSSLLDEKEREALINRARELEQEEALINNALIEIEKSLAGIRLRQIDKRSQTELNNLLTEVASLEEDLQRRIGALKQKQSDQLLLNQKKGETFALWETQKKECSRWDKLHQLIGSADGKKFRNFAQGITFEIMVAEANRRLKNMSDRYLLARDPQKPLELTVLDNYQAGQMRSTKNLSGGESFIVSLALALGLASMNGNSMRVDSLFLDEGFGTLDEETLDTALDCLASLSHSGKTVGVISHVPALVERIGVKINVCPKKNGRSVISGPGVKQL